MNVIMRRIYLEALYFDSELTISFYFDNEYRINCAPYFSLVLNPFS